MSARSDLHFVRKFSTYRFITCSGARQRASPEPESTFISWRNRDVPIVTHVAANMIVLVLSIIYLSFLLVLNTGDDENARDRSQLDPLIKSDHYYVTGVEPINARWSQVRQVLITERNESHARVIKGDIRPRFYDIVVNCFSFFFYDLSIATFGCERGTSSMGISYLSNYATQ